MTTTTPQFRPSPAAPAPDARRRRLLAAAGVGACALLSAGCGGRVALPATGGSRGGFGFGGWAMGTTYTVRIAGATLSDSARRAAQQAVAQALEAVEAAMSHYRADSELARFHAAPVGTAFALSAPTAQVLAVALAVGRDSGGAFDVALGRAVDGWGFGPSGRRETPPPAAERAAWRGDRGALALDAAAGRLVRAAPVHVNLSGIAKGHGVDVAMAALRGLGIGDAMVEVGGEIATVGHNAQGRPWQLAIERPDAATPQRAVLRTVPLAGRALATSGDYRNFFVHGGRRYSHELDPAHGEPVAHALASVSVVADDCTRADAWSTALFVLGPERGPAVAARAGLAAHFVERGADGRLRERTTPAFDALGAAAV